MRLLLVLGLAACGQEGTISFGLVFPPGTTRLPAEAVTARLLLDDPARVEEAPIGADGRFSVSLAVPGEGGSTRLTFEALDAAGDTLVRGTSPALPRAAYNDLFDLYVAPPRSFAEAPMSFAAARAEVGAAALPYGVVLAGGSDQAGARLADTFVYDAYTHELFAAAPLPAPRAAPALASASFGLVWIFGGVDPEGRTTADLWLFDTNAPPLGVITPIAGAADASLARAGAAVAPLGGDRFLLTGDPPALLDGARRQVTAIASAPPEAAGATTAATRARADAVEVVVAGTGVVLFYDPAGDVWSTPPGPVPATAPRAIVLPGGDVALVTETEILRVGADVTTAATLASSRPGAAVGLAQGVLVVADGADAELYDAATLAPVGVIPLVEPRAGATVARLANDILLVAGGGARRLEVFTP